MSDAAPIDARPMLNAYPDSMGGRLADIVDLVARPDLAGAFGSFYILPSLFNTDLDRGFSVIDYGLNEMYASQADLDAIRSLGLDLKLDFVVNHLSVLLREDREVVDDEVELQVQAERADRVQVRLACIHLVEAVVDHGEAAIQVRVEEAGQDVERPEGAGEVRPCHQVDDVGEPTAHAVRVRVQHRPGVDRRGVRH